MAGDLYDINVIYNPSTPETILVSVADVSGGVPIGGTTNQSLFKNSNTDGDASWKNIRGFTFVQDTVPTPTRIGETFFDISTGVTSGNAYVVVDNGSGGLIWVQFAPGSGSLNPTTWTNVSFINSWVNFGAGNQDVQYRKIGDNVYGRGICKSGLTATVAFVLPEGFRPPAPLNIPSINAVATPNSALLSVATNGNVAIYSSAIAAISFDIMFSTTA